MVIITPPNKSVQVNRQPTIVFDLTNESVTQSNIKKVTVANSTVVDNGSATGGSSYTVTITLKPNLDVESITIIPTTTFESFQTITANITIAVSGSSDVSASSTFTTKDDIFPAFENITPSPLSTDNATYTPIVFRVVDSQSGAAFTTKGNVSKNSIRVNNIAAVNNMRNASVTGTGIPPGTYVNYVKTTSFDGYTTTDGYINLSNPASSDGTDVELTFVNLNVTIDGTTAVDGGRVVEPSFGGKIEVVGQNLDVYLTRATEFNFEQNINVSVRAFDQDAYDGAYDGYAIQWSFQVVEGQNPEISPLLPLVNATNVPRDTPIRLEATHPGGIVFETLNMWLNGIRLFSDGAFNPAIQPDWSWSRTSINDGYLISIIPPSLFFTSSQTINIIGYIEDIRENLGAINYQFRIENFNAPQVINQYPSPNAVDILPSTDIRFTLKDSGGYDGYYVDGYDVDFSKLKITLDGYSVYEPGFSSYNGHSATFTQSLEQDAYGTMITYPCSTKIIRNDIYAYDIVINPQLSFDFNHQVQIAVEAYDKEGNSETTTYSFTTAPFESLITTANPSTGTYKNLLDGYGLQLGREFLTQVGITLTPNFIGDGYSQNTTIYYTLDGSTPNIDRYGRVLGTTKVYVDPVKLQKEGLNVLKFRSCDRAGNLEDVRQEIYMLEPLPPIPTITSFNIAQFSRKINTSAPVSIQVQFFNNLSNGNSVGPTINFPSTTIESPTVQVVLPGTEELQGRSLGSVCILTWSQVDTNSMIATIDLDLSSTDIQAIFGDGSRNVFIEITANNLLLSPRQYILPTATALGQKTARILANIDLPTTVIPLEKIATANSLTTGSYALLFNAGDLVKILDDIRPPVTTKVLIANASNPPFLIVQDPVQKLRTSRNARVELVATPLQSSTAIEFDTTQLPEFMYIGSDGQGKNQADAVLESLRILNVASTSEEILADFTLLQKGGAFTNQSSTPQLSSNFSSLEQQRSNLPDNTLVLLDFNGNTTNKTRQGELSSTATPIVDVTRAGNRVEFTITVPSSTFIDRQLLETALRNFTPVDLDIKVNYIEVD